MSISANGKWTITNVLLSLFVTAGLFLTGWMLESVIALREFAAAGDRFTASDARALETRMQHCEARHDVVSAMIENIQSDVDAIVDEDRRLHLTLDEYLGRDHQ